MTNIIDNLLNLADINDLFRFLKEYSAKHPPRLRQRWRINALTQ